VKTSARQYWRIGQIQAIQKAVKEDEELMVLFPNRLEVMRVLVGESPSFYLPD